MHRDAYLVKAADYGFCDYNATKETHRELRNKFKPVVLAGQYGQTPKGLAKVLGISVYEAKAYQEKEAKLYPVYQRWLRARTKRSSHSSTASKRNSAGTCGCRSARQVTTFARL